MKKYERKVVYPLLLIILILTSINFRMTYNQDQDLFWLYETLSDQKTVRKANTADTVVRIHNECFIIVDKRLDRIDSTLNLPY